MEESSSERPSRPEDIQYQVAVPFTCTLVMLGSVCWGGNISKHNRGRLEKIVKQASQIVGRPLDTVEALNKNKNDAHTE